MRRWQASVVGWGTALWAVGTAWTAAAWGIEPLYDAAGRYQMTIPATDDPADIYIPTGVSTGADVDGETSLEFPLVLLLQGGLVDKQSYSSYASTLARYGFVVVVPNHQRSATNPATGETLTGLLAEQSQVNQVLDFANRLDSDVDSPLYGRIDTERMAVVGHSFGGFAGLGAIQNICVPGVCSEEFERPEELMAGVVYGTSFQTPPDSGEFPPIANENIPVALIAGTADGVAQPTEVTSTYAQVQSPPKLFAAIAGANHYGITNENSDRDPSLPTVDQAVANNAIARWSGLFLRAHLLDDAAAYDYVYNTGDALDGQVATTSRPRPPNLSR